MKKDCPDRLPGQSSLASDALTRVRITAAVSELRVYSDQPQPYLAPVAIGAAAGRAGVLPAGNRLEIRIGELASDLLRAPGLELAGGEVITLAGGKTDEVFRAVRRLKSLKKLR